jgi:leucyl aminopeptidase
MPLSWSAETIEAIDASYGVVGVFDGETAPPAALGRGPVAELVQRLLASKDVPGGLGETTPLFGPAGWRAGAVLLVGLGKRDAFGPGPAFSAGVAAARRLAGKPRDRVAAVLPERGEDVATAFVEGLIVGQRGPGLRKAEPGRQPFGDLVVLASEPPGWLRRAEVVGGAVNLARDLVNTPPAEKPPRVLAERMAGLAGEVGLECEVWDEDRLRRERCGGLLGVAAGSDQPPALVVFSHRRGGDRPTLALVGKGVTFDSGGLSLKPTQSMEDMKADMTGAAVVVAALRAAAQLGLACNVTGYVVLTENMTGGRAMKLGDVLTMRNGKTVEVLNTDAEGRLILADALSLAVEASPARILDLATLTGACMVALGTKVAGLFSSDEAFAAEVLAACNRTGERAWRMPLDADYDEGLKSQVADMKNVGGKWGGAVTAAKFLQRFVGTTPWVHLDVAGPSWADADASTRDAGGTGCFVRTLVRLLEADAAR